MNVQPVSKHASGARITPAVSATPTAPAKEGEKLFVTYIDWTSTEDSFEQGEIGNGQTVLNETVNRSYDSLDALIADLSRRFGLTTNKDAYAISPDGGRIDCQMLVDENNSEVTQQDAVYKKWQAGQAKLWAAYIVIGIEIITRREPTADELKTLTGLDTF